MLKSIKQSKRLQANHRILGMHLGNQAWCAGINQGHRILANADMMALQQFRALEPASIQILLERSADLA